MDATSKMYKYIFAIVDGFTKFVWLFSTKSTGADEVVNKLEFWQSIFGNPQRIISDRGPAFISSVFVEFCKSNNIEHILITAGVPRGNGQIERVNRTILSVISKLSSEKPEHWYKHLSDVQRAINGTYHRSIGRSPFEVLFGTKIFDNKCSNVVQILKEELINEFEKDRDDLRNEAKRQIEKVQLENKKNFDRKRKQNFGYKVGDLVAIRRTQFVAGRKLANEYLGPYEIVKVKRNGRYEVRKAASFEGPNLTTTSNDYMKLWCYSEVDNEESSSPEVDE